MTEIPEVCVNVQKLYNANIGSVVDRPLLNTKWILPNSTIIVLGMCGILALFFKSCFAPACYLFFYFTQPPRIWYDRR